MATTTPNFGWPVPTSTDLVKDGATAIEALGDGIDASLLDLKGGTTGQVLAKTSATDLDFTWVTTDDTNAIQNAIVDAKGDLIAASANDTPARLAVGNNGETLVADSSTSTGLKWQAPADLYPWTTWTPSWTNLTVGNGTQTARYKNIGKLIYAELKLTLGSTSSVGTGPYVTFPFTEKVASYAGVGELTDAGTVSYVMAPQIAYGGLVFPNSLSTSASFGSPGQVTATSPFTWTTGDVISIRLTYEAA